MRFKTLPSGQFSHGSNTKGWLGSLHDAGQELGLLSSRSRIEGHGTRMMAIIYCCNICLRPLGGDDYTIKS